MKFTLGWLKDYLETDASLEKICDTLTAIGLEVEEVTDHAAALSDFIVAEIQDAKKHPDADKLQVCTVFDGDHTYQIVCGAANARTGLKTVLAREGVYIPAGDFKIRKTKIRGVESNGMLCSAAELGTAEDSDGIVELSNNAVPGAHAAPALGLDDPTIEIAITPNRADCLGVYGIARDLAAAGLGTLKTLSLPALPPAPPSPLTVSLKNEACPYFIGCTIQGVKNPPSPDWLQQRLRAIGLRPISTLVDITNYIAFTYGRPLHVYDVDKLQGDIIVRDSKKGESFDALNDKSYTLEDGMTVITDDSGVLGLGGIVGGESTGCTENTTNVFLETAYFDPVDIATTGRKLDILSDARYRFERGVDPDFVATGAALAVRMITDLCGGKPSEFVIAGDEPKWKHTIVFNPDLPHKLGGVYVDKLEVERILSSLGFHIDRNGDEWILTPPSWRGDVEGAADIVEEILRIKGYQSIPNTPLPVPEKKPTPILTQMQQRKHLAVRTLASKGARQIVSWSFIPNAQAKRFGGGDESLRLQNPINAELDTMRPSLLPNLLTAAANNHNRGIGSTYLFEAGAVYESVNTQKLNIATLRTGQTAEFTYPEARMNRTLRYSDAFDAKQDALQTLEALGVKIDSLTVILDAPGWYHPGRSGALALGTKNILAHFGEVHPSLVKEWDIPGRVSAAEIYMDAIPEKKAKSKAKPTLTTSPYQAVQRDFAFVVNANNAVADMLKILKNADKKLITDVSVMDVYSGKGMDSDKKSVAFTITLQAMDRTLTDEEITNVAKAITVAAATFGGVLRG